MLHFSDSKAMARALRKALAERRIEVSHSDSLELVARQFGFANWNMLSARIDAEAAPPLLPEGWKLTGSGGTDLYRIGIDPTQPGTLKLEATDRSGRTNADQFGSLMQTILADAWRGKTLRLSAELRGRGVTGGALWMRIDPASGRWLRFDNMLTRSGATGALHGDVGWTERSIVLDVPDAAATIHYGALVGSGELWVRHLRLEPVDPATVATTGPDCPTQPTNLDFRPAAGLG